MKKIEGVNPVKELLKSGKPIEKIEIYNGVNRDKIAFILAEAKKRWIKIEFTEKRDELDQGVAAFVVDYGYNKTLDEFIENIYGKEEAFVVVLDGIQDPRNFGAIIRSCEAFGVRGIIIPDRNSVKVNETVIKTSTGAIEHIDIVEVTNISVALEKLKKYGFWVYGAEAEGAKEYYKEKYPAKTCLVLGSEGQGIRKKVKEYCDIMIKIPMFGKINSLNVSVAGGILLSEISKNRRG